MLRALRLILIGCLAVALIAPPWISLPVAAASHEPHAHHEHHGHHAHHGDSQGSADHSTPSLDFAQCVVACATLTPLSPPLPLGSTRLAMRLSAPRGFWLHAYVPSPPDRPPRLSA